MSITARTLTCIALETTKYPPNTRVTVKPNLLEALGLFPVETDMCVAELAGLVILQLHIDNEIPRMY